MYRPLSPPVTYHRPRVPVPPYHNTFSGPVAPHMHHIYKGLSPPVVHSHPHHGVKVPLHYKLRAPCPTKSVPTTPAVLHPPAVFPILPEPIMPQIVPATPVATETTIVTTVPPVETPATGTLPVSTQSGFTTTVSPVETGRILLYQSGLLYNPTNALCCFPVRIFVSLAVVPFIFQFFKRFNQRHRHQQSKAKSTEPVFSLKKQNK